MHYKRETQLVGVSMLSNVILTLSLVGSLSLMREPDANAEIVFTPALLADCDFNPFFADQIKLPEMHSVLINEDVYGQKISGILSNGNLLRIEHAACNGYSLSTKVIIPVDFESNENLKVKAAVKMIAQSVFNSLLDFEKKLLKHLGHINLTDGSYHHQFDAGIFEIFELTIEKIGNLIIVEVSYSGN